MPATVFMTAHDQYAIAAFEIVQLARIAELRPWRTASTS
jgi:DNA-binding LytR/AlgR family response regulator